MQKMGIALIVLMACARVAQADTVTSGTWQALNHPLCTDGQPCFSADTPILLTDGTVMVHETCGSRQRFGIYATYWWHGFDKARWDHYFKAPTE
jgi:hypothetical protein